MAIDINDLIDVSEIQSVVDEFSKITNIAMAIGNRNGDLLIQAGFQDICQNFHRKHSSSCKNCTKSDVKLFESAFSGEHMQYKCLNNMWDISTPIIINEEVVGAIYLGQFIYDDDIIDYEVFKNQAKLYGYDEKEYLEALERVPRVSHQFIEDTMSFYVKFASVVALLSYKNINIQAVKKQQDSLIISLRESEKRFISTIKNIPDTILVFNQNHKIQYVNNSVSNIFGKPAPSLLGKNIEEIWTQEYFQIFFPVLEKALKTERTQSTDVKFNDPKNLQRYLTLTFVPIIEDGIDTEILCIIHDFTEEKKAQFEIEKLNEELEEKVAARTKQLSDANKELDMFTYSVSHDLKAPLRGIDGYSKILLEEFHDQLNEEGKFFLSTIRQSVGKMNQLIEDLLAFSRIERKPFQYASVDLKKLVISLVDELANGFLEGGGQIKVDVPNIYFKSSIEGISMALKNLIENAIKYSPDISNGMVEIYAEEREKTILIKVDDHGIGFDMKYHDKIFNIFERLQRAEDYPGTGIGLAIVKKIADRLHGKVWATSALGEGSIFYFEILKEE